MGQGAREAMNFVATVNEVILYPLIALLVGVAFLIFVWGVVEYVVSADNEQGRQQGVKHITWGIIGLVIMISAFAILSLAAATFGLNDQLRCADNPDDGGCAGVFEVPEFGGPTGGGSGANGPTGGGSGANGPTGGGG
ncbi:MAG: hypothetical protein ACOC4E_01675 [Patescibacteria group bacterium]